jgi:cytochrome c oxidase subunit 1
VGFNLFYFSMLVLGTMGMPRRYYNHLPQYHTGHVITSIGAFILVSGLLLFFGNLLAALFKGRKAGEQNPWGGVTLEWMIPTPPPLENFVTAPTVPDRPYAFNPEIIP